MNKAVKQHQEIRLQHLKNNLEVNHFEVSIVENTKEAHQKVLEMIPKQASVSYGGSETLKQCGILNSLQEGNYDFIDPFDATNKGFETYRQSVHVDYYLMSSNAITEDGHLFNIDGFGNRVSALTFGPKNVIVVVGINKITEDLDSAYKRVRSVAAPINALRLNKKTPCAVTGVCSDCKSPDRICSNYVITMNSNKPRRIKIVIVKEELGF